MLKALLYKIRHHFRPKSQYQGNSNFMIMFLLRTLSVTCNISQITYQLFCLLFVCHWTSVAKTNIVQWHSADQWESKERCFTDSAEAATSTLATLLLWNSDPFLSEQRPYVHTVWHRQPRILCTCLMLLIEFTCKP